MKIEDGIIMGLVRKNIAKENISFPIRFDERQQLILDAKGRIVSDIKQWRIPQPLNRSGEEQVLPGEIVAKLLNELRPNSNDEDDEQLEDRMIFI